MGNRAIVIFYDNDRISPTVYLHWCGGEVPKLLSELAESMKGRYGEPYQCAVLDVAKLAAGDIAFGSNSWRGDNYEANLRKAIKMHQEASTADFLNNQPKED